MQPKPESTLTLKFSEERSIEVAFYENTLTIVAMQGVQQVLLWMRENSQRKPDLRVSCKRTADGLNLAVDRGDDLPDWPADAWWPPNELPQISIETSGRIVTATTHVGGESVFDQFTLPA